MTSKRSRAVFEGDLQKQESPYVLYGSPLPPLDDQVRDDGSYVPLWKQEVKDDRGRKRLHGAFTGGFSAGYYNTVGSKEGWTPATFVSSRQNRLKDSNKSLQKRPEDFMDEEDLREAEESRHLSTTEGFAGLGTTQEDSMRRGGLIDILRVSGETMGIKLLKKMGWREGQGIGPKVRRRANLDAAGEDSAETYLFAPDDPPMISFVRKSDHKGMGFDGEAQLQPTNDKSSKGHGRPGLDDESDEDDKIDFASTKPSIKGLSRKPEPKTGFGVGILNDTGSDDEDAYEMGPKISYNKVIGGSKKASSKTKSSLGAANPLLKTKPIFTSKKKITAKTNSGFRKCHDGRLPLEGFVLSDELDLFASISLRDESYRPPDVPEGWKSSKTAQKSEVELDYISTADAAKNSSLNAQARAALLGEEQLPGKSVFDFMTPSARAKIARASGKSSLPAAGSEKAPPGFEATVEERQSHLQGLVPAPDRDSAVQALSRGVAGWMPYSEDEAKRSRYRVYLETQAGTRAGLPDRAEGVSQDDWIIELQEFARAAQVFRPVSGLMASRFTTSSTQSPGGSGTSESGVDGPSLLSKPLAKPEDPAEAAAKMGIFGPLTRSVQNFYPTRLLCKRFNVKPPDNVHFDSGSEHTTSISATERLFGPQQLHGSSMQDVDPLSESPTPRRLLEAGPSHTAASGELHVGYEPEAEQNLAIIDTERNEALEATRPGEAVFRAIFGSDDEDE